jgi:hypothetical protein
MAAQQQPGALQARMAFQQRQMTGPWQAGQQQGLMQREQQAAAVANQQQAAQAEQGQLQQVSEQQVEQAGTEFMSVRALGGEVPGCQAPGPACGLPGDTIHVLFTSNGSPYQNIQARIM